MKQVFIGDVHGKYKPYKRILKEHENTVQLGDMGVGFKRYSPHHEDVYPHGSYYPNPPYNAMVKGNHRFIRGNHDNPEVCVEHTQWIPDGTVEDNIMFVGGGLSIDKNFRVPGYSWWEDEELGTVEFARLLSVYEKAKPDVMVTHECPEVIARRILGAGFRPEKSLESRTRIWFDKFFEQHQPALWVFGHWHNSFECSVLGTEFVCLAELEVREFDV